MHKKPRTPWIPGAAQCPTKQEYMSDVFRADIHSYAAAALSGIDAADIKLGKYGNSKIHEQGRRALTLVYSGLASHDCPGATDACRSTCYAMGFRYLHAAAHRRGHGWKYSYLAHHDIPKLESVIRREITAAVRRAALLGITLAVRIHEAGDYVSVDHIKMWHRITRAYPGVIFWGYTRSDMVSDSMASTIGRLTTAANVHIRASFDPMLSEPIGARVSLPAITRSKLPGAVIVGKTRAGKLSGPATVTGTVNCPEQVTHGKIGCADCGLCWSASRPAIRFYKH